LGGNGSSALGQLVNVTRTTDLLAYKRDGTYKNPNGTNNWYIAGADNPYFDAYENPVTSHLSRIIGNVNAGYDFSKCLNVSYKLGGDFYTDRRKQIFAIVQPAYQLARRWKMFFTGRITSQL
jgi:hypothetical protein